MGEDDKRPQNPSDFAQFRSQLNLSLASAALACKLLHTPQIKKTNSEEDFLDIEFQKEPLQQEPIAKS